MQGTLAREHVSTQGTLASEHVSTQGTLAREACWHASTFLARRARNLARNLATCARKPKVPGASPAASYVQR